jgi:2-(3-amino-3-carboxypropyl)histidine synthase
VKFKISEIPRISARKVGVQLPDGLKRYAVEIAQKLEKNGHEVLISGESCFGACDIDLNLLQDVDVLLHFGHTKVVELDRVIYIPVFVDYNPEIDLDIPEKKISLIATAQYCHKLPEVKRYLEGKGYLVELKKGSSRVQMKGQVLGCNYTALRDSQSEAILFIGDGLFHARGAAMYTGKKVYAFDPIAGKLEEVDVSGFLKERYFQISRCIDKKCVGIIVSYKPGQKRFSLARKLRDEAIRMKINACIICVDDLTPEKLYNLPFDFYVNTACPRITYDDFRNFRKPVLSPTEFKILLESESEIFIDEIE